MTKVEQVAKAIFDRSLEPDNFAEFGVPRADSLKLARAALEATREPTEAMVLAVVNKFGYLPGATFWADVHNTMIDAALAEPVAPAEDYGEDPLGLKGRE